MRQSGLAGSGGMLNACMYVCMYMYVYVESVSTTHLTVIVVVTQKKLKICEWQFRGMGPRQKLNSMVVFLTCIP